MYIFTCRHIFIYIYVYTWMEISHTPHTYIYTSQNTYSCLEVRHVPLVHVSSTYGLRMCTRMCFRVVVYADYIADGGHRLLKAPDALDEEKLRLRKKKKNRDRKLRQRRLETGSNPRVQSAMSNLTVWPASPDSRIEPASPSS